MIGQLEALLCDVGSRVHEDEETAVIETDKVAISVRAPESGVVTAVLKGVGDWVAVGDHVYAFAPKRRPSASGSGPPSAHASWRRRGGCRTRTTRR